MPSLVRFMIRHCLIGAGLGVAVGIGLMTIDAWGLAALARQASFGLAAWILLPWGFAVTFGGVQVGIAVMLLDPEESPPKGKRQKIVQPRVLAPVHARSVRHKPR